jgi:hypothetical protein
MGCQRTAAGSHLPSGANIAHARALSPEEVQASPREADEVRGKGDGKLKH